MRIRTGACAIAALLVAACGGSAPIATQAPAITAPPLAATPAPVGHAIAAKGTAKNGVSAKFTLAAGAYLVEYQSTAPEGGCAFSLLLEPKAGGKIIESLITLPDVSGQAGPFSSSTTWSDVPAGTYVLEEDRSGLLNCKGAWSATLTPG